MVTDELTEEDFVRADLLALSQFGWMTAAEPSPTPSPSPVESASPAATLTQSVSELSAQRAAAERSKIYRSGATYSDGLDRVAKNSGSAFLQRTRFRSCHVDAIAELRRSTRAARRHRNLVRLDRQAPRRRDPIETIPIMAGS